jgi:HK97 family phage prohead protease
MSNTQIQGYALLWNSPYPFVENGQGYIEEIDPSALKNADISDVRFLRDHNQSLILGSTKSGTLRLKIDAVGLFFSADVPNTVEGKDTAELIRKKILNQTSFGFSTPGGDGSKWTTHGGTAVRRIMKISKLFDVSVVTFPANPKTSVWLKEDSTAKASILQLPATTQTPLPMLQTIAKAEHVARLAEMHEREYVAFLQGTGSAQHPAPVEHEHEQPAHRAGMYKLAIPSAHYECASADVKNQHRKAIFAKAAEVQETAGMAPDEISAKRAKQAQQVGGDLWAKMQVIQAREAFLKAPRPLF